MTASGPGGQGPGGQGPGLVAQAAVRLDGTDFAGAILQSVSFGRPRLGASYVPESLLIAVPSALWPSKLSHGNGLINPTGLEIEHFGLQNVNFLPTLPGLYMGFLAPPWLIAFLAFLGLLAGRGERAQIGALPHVVSAAIVDEKGEFLRFLLLAGRL